MLIRSDSYDKVRDALRWQIPEYFNMGVDVCDKHAERTPDKTALIIEDEDGDVTQYSFLALKKLSNKLANLYVARGLKPGDRVAILLSQSVETGIAHIAAWKAGLISIPMFTLFGEDALEFRLSDCGAKALVTDTENYQKIEAIRDKLPNLETVLLTGSGDFSVDGTSPVSLWKALDDASDAFTPLNTKSEEPGLIIYTSGTTGNPKGALHAHRALLGHLPGVEFPHEFFPKPDDLMWTPADWAWIGGLMNVLMACRYWPKGPASTIRKRRWP